MSLVRGKSNNTFDVISGGFNGVVAQVIDNLESTSTVDALSANMGRELNEKINDDSGWVSADETWTYSSVDDPTGVITISGDKTTKYSLGMRIKFTNGGNTIYGIITKLSYSNPNTTMTFLHEIDPTDSLALHLMANSAITANYYSTMKVPYGFPLEVEKWQISAIVNNQANMFTVSARTAKTMLSIELPIGLWNIENIGWVNWRTGSPGVVFDGNYGLSLQQDTQASPAYGGFNQITYVADTSNNPGGDFRSNVSTSLLGYKVTNKQTIYGNAYQYSPNAQYQLFGTISLKATIAYL